MNIISRRNFGVLAGAVMPALIAGGAQADTLFTSFAFPATGAPTPRTMPARLAEIKNVRDFGALGDNVNDTVAIQATVDAAIAVGGGTIFFPEGHYRVTSSIDLSAANSTPLNFLGVGAATDINSLFLNDFVFKRSLVSPSNTAVLSFEKLSVQNGTGGGIQAGSCQQLSLRDVGLGGQGVSLTTEDSAGNSSQNIRLDSCKIGSSITGTALIIGGSGVMTGCDFVGSNIGVLAYGKGLHISGCRAEDCITGFKLGLDSADTDQGMSGFSILSTSTEGNITGMDIAGTCVGGFFMFGVLGHQTSGPHEDTETDYGLRIRADKAQGCVFYGVTTQSWFKVAGISIENASTRANNVFLACNGSAPFGGGVPWILPTNAYTAQFVQCNTSPVWTYSQLPTGGDLVEGDEYNISDAATGNCADGFCNWGTNVTGGGGSLNRLVRYNGTNWTVVGK